LSCQMIKIWLTKDYLGGITRERQRQISHSHSVKNSPRHRGRVVRLHNTHANLQFFATNLIVYIVPNTKLGVIEKNMDGLMKYKILFIQ
jgi:hypothetical protein